MFLKNNTGTDLIQSVLFGVGVAAVAIIFVALINNGFQTAGLSASGATEGTGSVLESSTSVLTGALD